jgi:hypothetical protein
MKVLERFEPRPSSVAAVRRWVKTALTERGCGHLVAPVTLVASELASAAVVASEEPFEVELRGDGVVRLTVQGAADGNTLGPERRSIVESVCSDWGVEAHGAARRVWCEVEVARD